MLRSQVNKNIYELIIDFYFLLNNKNWIKDYIFWELKLLKILGYDLELINLVDKKNIDNKTHYISKSSTKK